MILDAQAFYSKDQAITLTTLTASTNVLDHGETAEIAYKVGGVPGKIKHSYGYANIPLLLQITDEFTTSASATHLKVVFQCCDDAAGTGAVDVLDFQVPIARLKVGYRFPIDKFPRDITKRFTRIMYAAVGGAFDGGTLNAMVVGAVDSAYGSNRGY